jgi:hypothetical protein
MLRGLTDIRPPVLDQTIPYLLRARYCARDIRIAFVEKRFGTEHDTNGVKSR